MDFSDPTIQIAVKVLLSVAVSSAVAVFLLLRWFPLFCLQTIERLDIAWNGYTLKRLTLSDGFSFEYIERGTRNGCKHTLFMLHGFRGSKAEFNTITKHLPKDDIHIISLSLPGHGGTTRDYNVGYKLEEISARIRQFVEGVGLTDSKFHLLGFSFGGLLAGLYAKNHPDDLLSLTLMCPAGFCPRDDLKQAQVEAMENMRACAFNYDASMEETKKLFKEFQPGGKPPPDFFMRAMRQTGRVDLGFFRQVFEEMQGPGRAYFLEGCKEQIKTPLLALWGTDDRIVRPPTEKQMSQGMPCLKKFVLIPNGSHLINIDSPLRCASEIQAHIKEYA